MEIFFNAVNLMFPSEVTLPRAAELSQRIEGMLPARNLSRLFPLLAQENQADVEFFMDFSLDREKRSIVKGQVRAKLSLVCQRCLEPYLCEIMSDFSLVAVESLAEAVQLDKRYESVVLHDHKLLVAEVIEDELLLDLPLVPRHPLEQCKVVHLGNVNETKKNNPFSGLEALKKEPDPSK